ncbi:MAG: hypothetical protein PUF72_11940 [Clostridiales bacterium]|nr:hypothetical protein [Clostridiales bacterium]
MTAFEKFLWSCAYAGICSLTVLAVGVFIPRDIFNCRSWFFRERAWESKLYVFLRVPKWKMRVPDMSIYVKRLMRKRLDNGMSADKMNALVAETCVAESAHVLLCFLALGMVLIWESSGGAVCTLLYAFGNIPYIIIQRYNRPRLMRTLEKQLHREAKELAV